MPRICISGYYGFGNAGDEWILEALVAGLRPAGHALTVLSAAPSETQARHGVPAVLRWNLLACARAIASCEVFISGGGGLLQDATGPWTPAYYLALIFLAKALGKRVVVVGQGLGPIRRTWNRWLCRKVLSGVDRLILRDKKSLDWCRSLGLPAAKLVLGADVVWTLSAPDSVGARSAWGICLRADALAGRTPVWLDSWLALAQRRKVRVHWVVLGNGGDAELARVQQTRYAGPSDVVDVSNRTWREAAAAVHGLECLVSMRYHGLVLGALAGVAVCGRGHDPKLEQLMIELDAPEVEALETVSQWEEALAGLSAGAQAARVAVLRARASEAIADLRARLANQ